MERGYCYNTCRKEKWFCCHDCIRKTQCVKELKEKFDHNFIPCTKKKEECSNYHK